jgi:cysteine synthase A
VRVEAVIPQQAESAVVDALRQLDATITQLAPEQATHYMLQAGEDPQAYIVDQFHDGRIVDFYRSLAVEIFDELPDVAAIVVGIGTAASIMGIARQVRQRGQACRVVGVWPKEFDPTWQSPYQGHGIAGLAPPVRETHLQRNLVDEIVRVASADAVARTAHILQHTGLPAGTSSGATLEAALQLRKDGIGGPIVCLFASAAPNYLPDTP